MNKQHLSSVDNHILNRRFIVSGIAVLSAACWGLGTVMSRVVLDVMPPYTLLVLQLSSSITFLALVLAVQGRLTGVNVRLGLPGLFEPGLAYLLGILGLAFTTASNASLIGSIEPILVIALAWLFLRERVTRRLVFLSIIAVIGVGLVTVSDGMLHSQGTALGDLLILLGTLSGAIYVIVARRLLSDRPPLNLTFMQQIVGLFMVVVIWLIAAFFQSTTAAVPPVPLSMVLLAIASGVIQYALAFWLYLIALQKLSASIASFYLTLIPLFGVGGAYVILGEQLTFWQWIGALCILAAVVLLSVDQQSTSTSEGEKEEYY